MSINVLLHVRAVFGQEPEHLFCAFLDAGNERKVALEISAVRISISIEKLLENLDAVVDNGNDKWSTVFCLFIDVCSLFDELFEILY